MDQTILDNLRTAYDAKARERDTVTIEPWKAEEREYFLRQLRSESKKRLLEIGSGPGRDGLFFQKHGLSVICTDLSQKMVSLCLEKGLDAHVMDFLHLDFPECSFDGVFALNSLLHVPKVSIPSVLEHINRLLCPHGIFYIGVYGGENFEGVLKQDDHEPKRFFSFHTDISILSLVNSIFDLVYFRHVNPGWSLPTHFQSLVVRKKAESGVVENG